MIDAMHRLVLGIAPAGGQRGSRHNAQLAMVSDAVQVRDRLEADRALSRTSSTPRRVARRA